NADLFEAIEAGVIKNYITDFGTEEVLNKDNIIVFPHVGGSTEEAELNCAIAAGQTIRRFMETGEIINSVNFPNVKQFLDAPYRITLINKNIPNMVATITTAVSELGINIDNIINKSKGDYAYTLLDLDEADKVKIEQLVAKFEATDAIVKVRVIQNKN
ncbi:phosphoglycerate dehydrogenase, partial [Streptococcus suis]